MPPPLFLANVMPANLPSHDAGGTAGDLYVVVRTAPDTRFERDGTNLWHREEIPVADAVLGTSLDASR
jgi:molecular chaperone DnaJ